MRPVAAAVAAREVGLVRCLCRLAELFGEDRHPFEVVAVLLAPFGVLALALGSHLGEHVGGVTHRRLRRRSERSPRTAHPPTSCRTVAWRSAHARRSGRVWARWRAC